MLGPVRDFFANPARQALGWAAVGILGIIFAALGVMLILGDNDSSPVAASSAASPTPMRTPTAVPSPSPSATASPTASPTPAETPTPAPTATRAASTGGGGGANNPTPVPYVATPEPTPLPVVTAGGPYCNTVGQTVTPHSVFGAFTIAGVAAPVGSVVSLAFDGVVGPGVKTTAAGGYKVVFSAGGVECANRVGAVLSVVYDGVFYSTGHSVGDAQSQQGFVNFTLNVP